MVLLVKNTLMSFDTMKLWRLWLTGLVGLSLLATLTLAQETPDATKEGGGGEQAAPEKAVGSTRPPLTGNPQIDYLQDPNLPHELKGYDLSDYPFYNRLPPDLLDGKFNFTCDGRHDGFYASIPHKCQVYHNCLFSQRYDFLCANYTVFDQTNFICHYVSEVDCPGSEKHYDRNEQLYVTTTTTTPRPVTQIIYVDRPAPLGGPSRIRPKRPRRPNFKRPGSKRGPGRLTTTTTPAPTYYDYDYYGDYYDQYYEYYDDVTTTTTTTTTTPRPRRRLGRPRPGGRPGVRRRRPGGRPGGIRERQRTRLGPNNDDFSAPRGSRVQGSGAPQQQLPRDENEGGAQNQPSGGRRRRPGRPGSTGPKVGPRRKKPTTTTTTTTEATQDYYYDDYYDYANDDNNVNTSTTTTSAPTRRPRPSRTRSSSRNRPAAQDQAAAATELGASSTSGGDQRGNTGRVSVRRKPVSSRQPQDQSQSSQIRTETQQPRVGPRFPPRRTQSGVNVPEEPQVAEVEPPTTAGDDGLGASEVQPLVRGRPVARLGRRTTTPPPQDYLDEYSDY